MVKVIGIDTILINSGAANQNLNTKTFKSLLGVGILTNDYNAFTTHYDNAIQKALISAGYNKDKRVYSNYDFTKIYNITTVPIHELFFKEINKHIDGICIFFTAFSKTSKMRSYGRLEKELKHKLSHSVLGFDEILNKLDPYFPLIGIWRYRDYLRQNVDEIFVDGVTSKPFDGWREIQDLPIKIMFSGDKCNPLISTADILAYLITLRSKKRYRISRNKEKSKYTPDNLLSMLPELKNKIKVAIINEKAFRYISPLTNKGLNINYKLKHPIIFLLKDKSQYLTTEVLESLPNFNLIYDFACSKGASVKFYDKDEDKGRMEKGDYIVYFSEEGKKAATMINRIVPEIKVMEFNGSKLM